MTEIQKLTEKTAEIKAEVVAGAESAVQATATEAKKEFAEVAQVSWLREHWVVVVVLGLVVGVLTAVAFH